MRTPPGEHPLNLSTLSGLAGLSHIGKYTVFTMPFALSVLSPRRGLKGKTRVNGSIGGSIVSDLMRPVPLRELLTRIFSEYRKSGTIFGIGEDRFYKPAGSKTIRVFGEPCDTPLGPAAGPHTQLTQNIITSYLAGGRFMELKTVQIMDTLEIPKPCIDAEDEGFNTEWSTEFTLERAYDEYVKAWVILHLMDSFFGLRKTAEKSFIFNMSVGYNLEGIKTEKMQNFIHGLMDASTRDLLDSYRKEVQELLKDPALTSFWDGREEELTQAAAAIPDQICRSVTLSTMHGCPPAEIEAICRYMLTEKKLPTFVKLNPTLLGYDRVREILDGLGFGYVSLSREAFSHDLQYQDAVGMLTRLKELAAREGIGFGMKLTNTLGSINDKGALPGEEMYMSGRALYPLSVNLAARLTADLGGDIPISFAGGAGKLNVKGIFDTGIQPITMATELLKPGGYGRLTDCLNLLEEEPSWDKPGIDVPALTRLAEESLGAEFTRKDFRGWDKVSVPGPLPLFDCYVAPCKVACPIHQDVPEYIRLVGQKRYKEALDLIYRRNALPAITAWICDHQCQSHCTRLDYEGAVQIREMKKVAVEKGWDEYKAAWKKPQTHDTAPAAVIGAGPAGLSAAFFLARQGIPVTIFEKARDAGGVVSQVLPRFRLPAEAVRQDIDFIQAQGVEIRYNSAGETLTGLREKGFKEILVAVGAEKGNPLPLAQGQEKVTDALEFLTAFREVESANPYGEHLGIVGGGNTAMDAARVAKRLKGVKDVTVLYRRTEREMPADREEYREAVEEGVVFNFLSNPESLEGGALRVRKMTLGEPDESGRRRPVAAEEVYTLPASHIVAAISETVDTGLLKAMGLAFEGRSPQADPECCATGEPGVYLLGDARTGPSTIVACIAEGRKAADHILASRGLEAITDPGPVPTEVGAIPGRKGRIQESRAADNREEFASREMDRCLECHVICNKCVDVCPNRANIALPLKGFGQANQILHIDAYCNECGNCGQFCPWEGRPYQDKMTIFNLETDFTHSENSGFFWNGRTGLLRVGKTVYNLDRKEGVLGVKEPAGESLEKILSVIDQVEQDYSYLLGPVTEY